MLPTATEPATATATSTLLLAWAESSELFSRLEAETEVSGHATVLGHRRAYAVIDHPLAGPRLAFEVNGYLLPFAGMPSYGFEDNWIEHSHLLNENLVEHLADHAQLIERPISADPVEVRDSLIRVARAHQQALRLGDSRLALESEDGYEMNEKIRGGGSFTGRKAVLRCTVLTLPGQLRKSAVMNWFGY